MPRKIGYKCTEQARKNMREGARGRKSKLCFLYGFTEAFVEEQRVSGKSWCNVCKSWYEGKGKRCKDCSHKANIEYYKAKPEYHRERRQKFYAEHREAALKYRRFYSLKSYGVTPEWYESKMAEQNSGCAICGNGEQQRQLAIDHNHLCCNKPRGKSACDKCRRGLLCDKCNGALERIERDPEWGIKALAYLGRYPLNGPPDLQLAGNSEALALAGADVEVRN